MEQAMAHYLVSYAYLSPNFAISLSQCFRLIFCSYVPLLMLASSAKEKITCKSEVAVLLSNRKVEAAPEEPTDSDGLNQGIPGFLIEKVAERETLVTLMTIIDAAITRKTLLLDLLEKFNIRCVDCLPFGEGRSANLRLSGLLESHHAWLRANLEVTNRSLDIAHAYLQIMYGKSYSST